MVSPIFGLPNKKKNSSAAGKVGAFLAAPAGSRAAKLAPAGGASYSLGYFVRRDEITDQTQP